jgi:mono/diheme cytochrome c family protein
MVVRRGFPKPPTYHDDRLRNAPVGHFFDVMTNGWGKMNSYAAQVSPADRWAIAAYIRTLQMAQDPEMNLKMSSQSNSAAPSTSPAPTANSNGGVRR